MKNYTLLFLLLGLSIFCSAQDVTLFEVDGKWGVRSAKGKVIAKPQYDRARILELGDRKLIFIALGYKGGLINEQGKTILKIKNQGIYTLGDQYLYTWIGTRGRIIDLNGKTVMKGFQNIGISSFWKGQSRPFKKRGKWGFINQHNLQIDIPFEYDQLGMHNTTQPNDGLNCLVKAGKHILLNKYGKQVVDTIFDDTYTIPIGAFAKLNNKWGLIDSLGTEIIPFAYDSYKHHNTSMYLLSTTEGLRAVSPHTGQYMDTLVYDTIQYAIKGFSSVRKNGKWGIINSETAEEILPIIYDQLDYPDYNSPKIYTRKDNKWEAFNTAGEKLTKAKYDTIIDRSFYPTILVMQNRKYGLISRYSYDELTPCIYDEVKLIGYNHYMVRLGDKWGIAFSRVRLEDMVPKARDNYVTPIQYDEIAYNDAEQSPNYLRIRQGDKWGYLHIGLYIYRTKDIYPIPCMYDDAKDTSDKMEGQTVVKKEGKWGAIDLLQRGNTIIDFTFDTANDLYNAHPELHPRKHIIM